jgi:GT2 family glycosyltransferase
LSTTLIDVVVPVYQGLDATRRCLESVLTSRSVTGFELIVIDDASPDPELSAWLDEVAAAGRITLRRNLENLGFVATVNRAMALHPERDAVLLNSDTEVAGDWLDRLYACVKRDDRIGTATPFSNNGSICSYPNALAANELPAGTNLAELDALFARVTAGQCRDLPTGGGVCFYVRRACWQAVGEFDAGRFGRGYGEECDFSLRAAKAGWRNVLCADVFVYHQGSVSFGAERESLMASAETVMAELHPDYPALVMTFLRADPLRTLRDNVSRVRQSLTGDTTVTDELIAERETRMSWLTDRLVEAEQQAAVMRTALAEAAQVGAAGCSPAGQGIESRADGGAVHLVAVDVPYGRVLTAFLTETEVRVRRTPRLGKAGRGCALVALGAVRWLARRLCG